MADHPRVFLDTNVLLYMYSDDKTRSERAEDVLAEGGVVSVQVLNEFASAATRKFGIPMKIVRETLTTVRNICSVVPVDLETHSDGLDITERYGYSVYDAMIIAAALRSGCGTLYSQDMQAGQTIGSVTIRNPFA